MKQPFVRLTFKVGQDGRAVPDFSPEEMRGMTRGAACRATLVGEEGTSLLAINEIADLLAYNLYPQELEAWAFEPSARCDPGRICVMLHDDREGIPDAR